MNPVSDSSNLSANIYNDLEENNIQYFEDVEGGHKQGSQGIQTKVVKPIDNDNMKENQYLTSNRNIMNALLNVRQNEFDLQLQRIYYSPNCQYFYLTLMIIAVILIIATIVEYSVIDSGWFLFVEFVLNFLIIADYAMRVRLVGAKRFFAEGKWNYFDTVVVVICALLYLILLISSASDSNLLEEISEELLLIIWGVFQTLRMILIAKKQKQAQISARTLIDFSNVMESDMNDQNLKNNEAEEVIVFDMKKMEQKQRQQRQVIGPKRLRNSYGSNSNRGVKYDHSMGEMHEIELQEMHKTTKSNYKRQGLGGYEDEEESLDNSVGKLD